MPFGIWTVEADFVSLSLFWFTNASMLVTILIFGQTSVLWWSIVFALFLSFSSGQMLLFYIMFEVSVIPIVLMIAFFGAQPERILSAMYLMTYTMLFSIPALFLFIILNKSFLYNSFLTPTGVLTMMLLVPFLVKMPVTGLHFWLPKAHVEASTTGSMVLAGLLLKLGSYGLYRTMVLLPLLAMVSHTGFWLVLSLMSSAMTILQSDIKKMVAYSSVVHMTLLLLLLTSVSFKATILVMVSISHGVASVALFAILGALSNTASSRLMFLLSSEEKMHWSLYLGGTALLLNASVPPLASFFPEVFLVMVLIKFGLLILIWFILLSMTICYYNMVILSSMNQIKIANKATDATPCQFLLPMNYNFLLNLLLLLWTFLF